MRRLVVGNLNYSSWSMRAWLALRLARVEFGIFDVGIYTSSDWKEKILSFSGAGQVPILIDGALSIHQSLAICEYAAELSPEAGLWPEDAALRARGRALSCEMLSGFDQIRSKMPSNLRGRALRTPKGDVLDSQVGRVFSIWEASLATSKGDYLLGEFSVVDCMYMPVVSRFRTYGVALQGPVKDYCTRVLQHPLVVELEGVAASTEQIPQLDIFLEGAGNP